MEVRGAGKVGAAVLPHLSRVRSCRLDSWPPALASLLEALASTGASEQVWEACLPSWVPRPPRSDLGPGGAAGF